MLRVESVSEKPAEHAPRRLHFLYHELRVGGSDYSYVLDRDEFDRHVNLFVQIRQAAGSEVWPEVTFDDGHISNYEYALSALQSRCLTAHFFITVGWTGNKPGFMGWQELRSLHESGQMIGAHGWSHSFLTHCTREDLNRELSGARMILEDKLGTSITTMSLPGGRYNQRVIAACQKAGYTQIYTSIPRAERDPSGLMVGRLNIRAGMTLENIRSLLEPGSSALASLERQYRIKTAAKTLLGDRLYDKLWALLNRKEPDSGADGARSE